MADAGVGLGTRDDALGAWRVVCCAMTAGEVTVLAAEVAGNSSKSISISPQAHRTRRLEGAAREVGAAAASVSVEAVVGCVLVEACWWLEGLRVVAMSPGSGSL